MYVPALSEKYSFWLIDWLIGENEYHTCFMELDSSCTGHELKNTVRYGMSKSKKHYYTFKFWERTKSFSNYGCLIIGQDDSFFESRLFIVTNIWFYNLSSLLNKCLLYSLFLLSLLPFPFFSPCYSIFPLSCFLLLLPSSPGPGIQATVLSKDCQSHILS